jgi:ankyrin repeat protein
MTPLMLAAERGLNEIIAVLLATPTIKCRLVDNDNYSALILAAQNKHCESVKLLCNHDSTSEHLEIKNVFGKTSLFLAAEVGDLESLEALTSFRANSNTFSKRHATPLMIATTLNRELTFSFLMSRIEQIDNERMNALEIEVLVTVRKFTVSSAYRILIN